MLRKRLSRRDRAFSADALALLLLTKLTADQLSDELFRSTVQAALELANSTVQVAAAGFARRLLKAAVPDRRSGIIVALLLLLSLGLVTSVVAHGLQDDDRASPTSSGASWRGESSAAGDSGQRGCH
jgi:hypothetical protein